MPGKDGAKKGEKASSRDKSKAMAIGVTPDVVKVKNKKAKKDRSSKLETFIGGMLPALRKEMVKKKADAFSLESCAEYFQENSKYLATYILPLFRFLEKTSVICSRYGNYDGKHQVKTNMGFARVNYLSKYLTKEAFPPEMERYCMARFGKEWFKIPAKDGFRAKAAAANGHQGAFIVTLTGVYTDSFINKEGEKVLTINPLLSFESVRPPAPKKERKKREKKEEEEEEEVEDEEDDDGGTTVSPIGEFPGIGAQSTQIDPLVMSEEELSE